MKEEHYNHKANILKVENMLGFYADTLKIFCDILIVLLNTSLFKRMCTFLQNLMLWFSCYIILNRECPYPFIKMPLWFLLQAPALNSCVVFLL